MLFWQQQEYSRTTTNSRRRNGIRSSSRKKRHFEGTGVLLGYQSPGWGYFTSNLTSNLFTKALDSNVDPQKTNRYIRFLIKSLM